MTITVEFYEKLNKFSDLKEVAHLINDLNDLGIDDDELLDKCRKQLTSLKSQISIKKDDITLANVADMGLRALAKFKPSSDDVLREVIVAGVQTSLAALSLASTVAIREYINGGPARKLFFFKEGSRTQEQVMDGLTPLFGGIY